MSRKLDVGFEGDHVDCFNCTCTPPKSKGQNDDADDFKECHLSRNNLQNWEKWIEKRKRIHEHLSKSLDRPAGDLLMNLNEQYRRVQEERLTFEYCRINTYFDKYRGNPAFWKLPPGLVDKCDRSLNPVYFANQTKIEQNEIPLIEHVATPNYVMNEKDAFPCTRKIYTTRQNNKYTNIEKLSVKINQIEPHRPKLEELIIIGEKVLLEEVPDDTDVPLSNKLHSKENRESTEIKNDLFDPSSTEKTEYSPVDTPTIPKICFVINGHYFSKYNELGNGVLKISLIFEYTTSMKSPKVKYLKFENKGRTVVRFYWNRIKKFLLFRDLIKSGREECHYSFNFNKNEIVLPPNEQIEFPIWFKSNNIGNYSEIWEIRTKPSIWNGDFKLLVSLQAFVYPDGFAEKTKRIKERLDERVANTQVRDVLNDILQYLKFTESEPRISIFTEEQMFESANQEIYGTEKRPKYLYNKNVVEQLKLLYEEVKLSDTPKCWNYSVKDLLSIARQKDIWVYVENKTKEMLKGKQRRMELINKIQHENTAVEDKHSMIEAGRQSIVAVTEGTVQTYFWQLDTILQKLERPSMITNTERSKYFTAYSILRTYLFQMCDALEKCDNSTRTINDDCYPSYDYERVCAIEQAPGRLLFETFDDIWMNRTKRTQPQSKIDFIAMPKPHFLKDIPIENSNLVYKTYFGIADGKLIGKGKKEEVKKVHTEQEKESKTNKTVDLSNLDQISATKTMSHLINEDFDPFQEEYVPNNTTPRVSTVAHHDYNNTINSYDYQKYLIVYTYLTKAVDAMVDSLETMKESTANTETLGEVLKCTEKMHEVVKQEKHVEEIAMLTPKSEDMYFQNLLDMHLTNNTYIQDFFVKGKVKQALPEDHTQLICQETSKSNSSLSGSFCKSSAVVVAESVKSMISTDVQTSEVDYDFKKFSNILLESESSLHSVNSGISEKSSPNIFYYMDEEEEEEVKKKNT